MEDSGKFDVKVCEDTSILESSKLDAYKVIVLNFGFWEVPQLSERAQQNLLDVRPQGWRADAAALRLQFLPGLD